MNWIEFSRFYTFNRMYLKHYSMKAFFFFFHFLKNFIIFLILTLFVSFGSVIWWCGLKEWLRRMDLNH